MLVTHDMEEVEALVDHCCIMNSGHVIAQGIVHELRNRSKEKYELSLRTSVEKVVLLKNKLNIINCRYNRLCDVWLFKVLNE